MNPELNTSQERFYRVNDKWVFVFIYPLIALLTVHIGNDNTFKELLHIPSYYTDLLLAFGCVYGIGLYYRWFFFSLEKKYDWNNHLKKRLIRQCIYGLLLPVACIIGIELLYLIFLLKIPLRESSVFYLELPVISIFSVVLNLLYSIFYFRLHNLELNSKLELQKNIVLPAVAKDHKSSFIVNTGTRSLHIPEDQVAYFIILEKSTFLITIDNKRYLHNASLEKLMKELNPGRFFQLNRQIVVNRKSILSYSQTETRKLSIEIIPTLEDQVFVSKIRSSQFLSWLNPR